MSEWAVTEANRRRPADYRVCDIQTGTGSYTAATRLVAECMYWLYFLNSRRRGDMIIVLAEG